MRARVKSLGGVALAAERVARLAQLSCMRVMTVGAGDAGGMHATLEERTVVVDFVALLAIHVIEPGFQQRRAKGIKEVAQRFQDRPRTAGAAHGSRHRHRFPSPTNEAPSALPARSQPLASSRLCVHRSFAKILSWAVEFLPAARFRRPCHVVRGRPVAGFASDADLRPRRAEAPACLVVVLLEVGRVAPRALVVPVLIDAGPMQRIAGLQLSIGIEMIPALAARFLGTRIPSNSERLKPPAGKLDEILLQRRDAEGVADLKIAERAIGAVGPNPELAVLLVERACDAVLAERAPSKRPSTVFSVASCMASMLRAQPIFVFHRMALSARTGRSDERGRRNRDA